MLHAGNSRSRSRVDCSHGRLLQLAGGTEAPPDLRCELPSVVVHNRANLPLDIPDKENFKCSLELKQVECSSSNTAAGHESTSYKGARIVDVPPPVYPKRNVIWHLADSTEDKIDITITGNCRAFAPGWNAAGVPCKLLKKNDFDQYYEKYYVLHDYSLASAKKIEFLLKDLVEGVFKSVPIAVRVAGSLHGEAETFRASLEGLSNVYAVA